MHQNRQQASVLDCFAPCARDSAQQCLIRAAMCSRLAKLVGGQVRKKLYRLKNANIRAALKRPSGSVEVVADNDRYLGLLSVRLCGSESLRVHTHENWLDAV